MRVGLAEFHGGEDAPEDGFEGVDSEGPFLDRGGAAGAPALAFDEDGVGVVGEEGGEEVVGCAGEGGGGVGVVERLLGGEGRVWWVWMGWFEGGCRDAFPLYDFEGRFGWRWLVGVVAEVWGLL